MCHTAIYHDRFTTDSNEPWEMWSIVTRHLDNKRAARSVDVGFDLDAGEVMIVIETLGKSVIGTKLSITGPVNGQFNLPEQYMESELLDHIADRMSLPNAISVPQEVKRLVAKMNKFLDVARGLRKAETLTSDMRVLGPINDYLESGELEEFNKLPELIAVAGPTRSFGF